MIKRSFLGICYCLLFILGGCANRPIALTPETCSPSPCKVLAVGYSTTHFQERFMTRNLGHTFGLVGALISASLVDYDKLKGERLAANEYEKRLDTFDTSEYFFRSFPAQLPKSPLVSYDFTGSPETRVAVVAGIRATAPSANVTDPATGKTYENVGAFRMYYGMGMKVGNEQLGFRKTYRPYIRVIGIVKNLPNNKILWRDSVTAFGETKYVGGGADAVNIEPAALIATFKKLTPEAIALFSKSLNGAVFEEMPVLHALSEDDFEF